MLNVKKYLVNIGLLVLLDSARLNLIEYKWNFSCKY